MPELLYPLLSSLVVLFLCCLCCGLVVWKSKRRCVRELEALRSAWGKPVDRERDFYLYPSFLKAQNEVDESQYLDDYTWRDLNLDLVFACLDRTNSLPGEIELYRAMRASETTIEVLEGRDEVINFFQSDVAARESVQLQLSRLGRTLFTQGILDLLWGELPLRSRFTPLYRFLAVLVVPIVAVSILLRVNGLPYGMFAFYSIGALYFINFSIHYWSRRILEEQIRSVRYLSKMIVIGRALARLDIAGLDSSMRRLERYAMATKAIPRTTAVLLPELGSAFQIFDLVREHLSIFFLVEVRSFYSVLDKIRTHRTELQGLSRTLVLRFA